MPPRLSLPPDVLRLVSDRLTQRNASSFRGTSRDTRAAVPRQDTVERTAREIVRLIRHGIKSVPALITGRYTAHAHGLYGPAHKKGTGYIDVPGHEGLDESMQFSIGKGNKARLAAGLPPSPLGWSSPTKRPGGWHALTYASSERKAKFSTETPNGVAHVRVQVDRRSRDQVDVHFLVDFEGYVTVGDPDWYRVWSCVYPLAVNAQGGVSRPRDTQPYAGLEPGIGQHASPSQKELFRLTKAWLDAHLVEEVSRAMAGTPLPGVADLRAERSRVMDGMRTTMSNVSQRRQRRARKPVATGFTKLYRKISPRA